MAVRSPATSDLLASESHVVLCGSYHRDSAGLQAAFDELRNAGCEVLSPLDVNFVASRDDFLLAAHEVERHPREVEREHLRAISAADFVWLHAPNGYVGLSAAMEVGFAQSLGIPVYSREIPSDVTIREFVELADSPSMAAASLRQAGPRAPAVGLEPLQIYYGKRAKERGWNQETPEACLRFMREELDELRRELEQADPTTTAVSTGPAALELADVQLYVIHMANTLGIDLGMAVIHKEQINERRFGHRSAGRRG